MERGRRPRMQQATYMIGNMSERLRRVLPTLYTDDVGKVSLVDLYIGLIDLYKCHELVVVTVGSASCHALKVALEHPVDILLGGCRPVKSGRRGERTGVLAFGVSTKSTAWEDF